MKGFPHPMKGFPHPREGLPPPKGRASPTQGKGFPHPREGLPPAKGKASPTQGKGFPHPREGLPPPKGRASPTQGKGFPHPRERLPPPKGRASPTQGKASPTRGKQCPRQETERGLAVRPGNPSPLPALAPLICQCSGADYQSALHGSPHSADAAVRITPGGGVFYISGSPHRGFHVWRLAELLYNEGLFPLRKTPPACLPLAHLRQGNSWKPFGDDVWSKSSHMGRPFPMTDHLPAVHLILNRAPHRKNQEKNSPQG